jgi:hypothetical protein
VSCWILTWNASNWTVYGSIIDYSKKQDLVRSVSWCTSSDPSTKRSLSVMQEHPSTAIGIKQIKHNHSPCHQCCSFNWQNELYTISSTNPRWAFVVDYGPFSLWVIHKEGLCHSSGNINRLMMMIMTLQLFWPPVMVLYSRATQEVTGSISVQYKHLCALIVFVFGLGVSIYNLKVFDGRLV